MRYPSAIGDLRQAIPQRAAPLARLGSGAVPNYRGIRLSMCVLHLSKHTGTNSNRKPATACQTVSGQAFGMEQPMTGAMKQEELMTPLRDTALIAQIDHLSIPEGQIALWSLGQAGFVLKGGNTIAYIDPYLSNSVEAIGGPPRRIPIPVTPELITHAQVVLATHEHLDHTDVATLAPLMAASSQAVLVASPQGRQIALDAGIPGERIIVPRLGERIEIAGLTCVATPAAHYEYEVEPEGYSRWMGFIIECNGVTVYHSGDTLIFPELLKALEGHVIDVALLPINGRDFFREQEGIIGNLWPGEAIELAKAINAQVLIGMHNDLFAANRVPPGLLFDELDRRAPFLRCHLLQPGELFLYVKGEVS